MALVFRALVADSERHDVRRLLHGTAQAQAAHSRHYPNSQEGLYRNLDPVESVTLTERQPA
ncbi:hypothetical protein ACWD0J_31645 [Streptomyces sp. NPDC003011]